MSSPSSCSASARAPVQWHCSTLAFGDFLIDCNFMRRAGPAHRLLAASYLRPVAEAIDYQGPLSYFDMPAQDVPPSAFNARKAGLSAITASLWRLRVGLLHATVAADTIHVPHSDIRWRLACAPRRIEALRLPHENIYLAYCVRLGLAPQDLVVPMPVRPREVLVFPDSRQPAKQIPESTLRALTDINAATGVRTRVVRVRPPETGRIDAPGELSLWGLPALVRAVREAEVIVSADSLPGHLAEYFERPVFILTPQANEPLMPLSVLLCQRWGRFDAIGAYQQWITAYHG
ncbi:MAG: hypothetical protein RJA63_2032 [Pseudomonadota bacterium]|jgi:hypothetical protein